MGKPDAAKFAEFLSSLYSTGLAGKPPGKFLILITTICKWLGVRYLRPTILNRLTDELGRKGLLLVPFADRCQIISFTDVLRPRKLPGDKYLEILQEKPGLADSPAEILRELYEAKFNRRNRGTFRARPEDIAAICKEEYLTSQRIQELADELNELPLYRQQKAARQGYTLVDARSYLVVVESKLIWRAALCTDDDLECQRDSE